MMLEMPILPNEECEKVYGTKPGLGFNKDMHLCAGHLEGGSGSCGGDATSFRQKVFEFSSFRQYKFRQAYIRQIEISTLSLSKSLSVLNIKLIRTEVTSEGKYQLDPGK